MHLHDWVLFGHVLSAIAWMGGAVYVEALAANARRRSDPIALGVFFRDTARLNQRLFSVAGALTVAFGIWLVILTAWDWNQFWVLLSLLIVGITLVTDLFYTTPRIRAALGLLEEQGPGSGDARAFIEQVINIGHIRLGFLVIVLFLMIFQPVL
jgi:uncharacterized membrane protein